MRLPKVVLAHPLTERFELPISPLFVSAVALLLLAAAAGMAIRGRGHAPPQETPDARTAPGSPTGAAAVLFWLCRVIGLGLLVLAVVAGRLGHPAELSNIAPALIMGAGWPLLVAGSALLGRLWQWLDPFDTLARAVAPLGAGDGPEADTVWWAAVPAAAWVAYLTMWPGNLSPRSVGAALLLYTVVTLAGCLAVGRRTWLGRAEVFGVFFSMIAQVRLRGSRARLPAGAPMVLAVLGGGMVYGILRDSQLLADIGYGPRTTFYSGLALAAAVAMAGALAHLMQRREARSGLSGTLPVAMVPAVAGLALALALARNRFTTSVQLLPIMVSDPLGSGINLFGTRNWTFNGRPLGIVGLLVAQLVLLAVGHLVGIVLAGRRVSALPPEQRRRALSPSMWVLSVLLCVATAGVAATAL